MFDILAIGIFISLVGYGPCYIAVITDVHEKRQPEE